MTPRETRRLFYDRLAGATGQPVHAWHRRLGHAWPVSIEGNACTYHHAIVRAYTGSFEPRIGERRLIPRIHLNDMDCGVHELPAAMMRRWVTTPPKWHEPPLRFTRHPAYLELTTTLTELPDLAEWIAAWATARAADDLSLLPPSPFALEGDLSLAAVFEHNYLWTAAAEAEYEQRTAPAPGREVA
ncbi:MAG: hypothetical protein SYC29_12490 [Planctomycetota bacterium]|nr:hypothetical protein [Planctomycetota bacterium]